MHRCASAFGIKRRPEPEVVDAAIQSGLHAAQRDLLGAPVVAFPGKTRGQTHQRGLGFAQGKGFPIEHDGVGTGVPLAIPIGQLDDRSLESVIQLQSDPVRQDAAVL